MFMSDPVVETQRQAKQSVSFGPLSMDGTVRNFFDQLGPVGDVFLELFKGMLPEHEKFLDKSLGDILQVSQQGANSSTEKTVGFLNDVREVGADLHDLQMRASIGEATFTKDTIMEHVKSFVENHKDDFPNQTQNYLEAAREIIEQREAQFGDPQNWDMNAFMQDVKNNSAQIDVSRGVEFKTQGEDISYGKAVALKSIDDLKLKDPNVCIKGMDMNGHFEVEGFADLSKLELGDKATIELVKHDEINTGVFISPNGDGNGFYIDLMDEANLSEIDSAFTAELRAPVPQEQAVPQPGATSTLNAG